MTEARTVTAAFFDPANPQGVKHKLTVGFAGAGKGTVASAAPKFNCKKGCNVQILENTKVRLTAKARKGSVFLGWSGACKGAGACNVVLSKNVKVTAKFEPLKPRLRIIKTGSGSVASGVKGISCGRKCGANFVRGTKVALVAKASRGWRFVKWGGACKGTKTRCTVNMTTVKTVRVTFARIRR
jgi:Fe-S cluster biogenesis protein NfuA